MYAYTIKTKHVTVKLTDITSLQTTNLNILTAQDVVGGKTCLSRIDKLPPGDTTGNQSKVRLLVDEHRTVMENIMLGRNDKCPTLNKI